MRSKVCWATSPGESMGSATQSHPFVLAAHSTLIPMSLPVLISLAAEPITGAADTAFVARLGAPALAALGVGTTLLSGVFSGRFPAGPRPPERPGMAGGDHRRLGDVAGPVRYPAHLARCGQQPPGHRNKSSGSQSTRIERAAQPKGVDDSTSVEIRDRQPFTDGCL